MASGPSDCAVAPRRGGVGGTQRSRRLGPWSMPVPVSVASDIDGRSAHGRCMDGGVVIVMFFFCFFLLAGEGRELEEYDCACTDKYRKQTLHQGQDYEYGSRVLVPDFQSPNRAIKTGWAPPASWSGSSPRPTSTHPSPITRPPVDLSFFCCLHASLPLSSPSSSPPPLITAILPIRLTHLPSLRFVRMKPPRQQVFAHKR